jgi:hypothetical protein
VRIERNKREEVIELLEIILATIKRGDKISAVIELETDQISMLLSDDSFPESLD